MIYEHVNDCIKFETERGIAKTTLKELSRYLHEFVDYCQQNQIIAEQISSDFMRQYVQYQGKGHGPISIVKITPHSLRHAFATHAIEGDADLIVLKAVMGHASIHSTQIYIHPSLDTLRKAVNDHVAADILSDLIDKGVVILRMQQKWKKAA